MPTKKKTEPKAVANKVSAMTTTKKPAKKVVKKVAKKVSKKENVCACKKKCASNVAFWVNNGPVVHSLQDLLSTMKGMSEEQFAYHTKRDGNDFANWVRDCLLDSGSATKLARTKTRVGAVRVLTSICSCH